MNLGVERLTFSLRRLGDFLVSYVFYSSGHSLHCGFPTSVPLIATFFSINPRNKIMLRKTHLAVLLTLFLSVPFAQAQTLDQTFAGLFEQYLVEGFSLSPGTHGQHFLPASVEANDALIPALNTLISSQIASFPLSSTSPGVTFDFTTGQPISILGSQGPIFAETAETLGKGTINVGANFTYLSLDRIRGIPLESMRFTFLHQDVTGNGSLGDNSNESDLVDIYLDLQANASIFAAYGTYGVTNNLDISIAVPIVSVALEGESRGIVSSYTLPLLGQGNHHFGSDARTPILIKDIKYDDSAVGLGDIAVRLKYRFSTQSSTGLGALLDLRLPTGDEKNFLGTGNFGVRALFLVSKKYGDFTPHANIGYDYRGSDYDSDKLKVVIGFDQKIVSGLTFAFEFLGLVDIDQNKTVQLLPGTATIVDHVDGVPRSTRTLTRSNVPEFDSDSMYDLAAGFRYAPSERFQLLGNLLVPINKGGLRSRVAPTVGASFTF